jgi:hypothetical protein
MTRHDAEYQLEEIKKILRKVKDQTELSDVDRQNLQHKAERAYREIDDLIRFVHKKD